MAIHPTAIVDPGTVLGENVEIGPFVIIGPKCKVGSGTKIAAHAVLEGFTTIGENCQIATGAVLGGLPQDLNFGGEETFVEIGDGTAIRECVTINRATGEGNVTRVGDSCMLMAYSHLAHNCNLGNGVIIANSSQLGGYVEVADNAFISAGCVIHQFVKVGRLAILAGLGAVLQDLPPFSMNHGRPARIMGLNKIGLKRKGLNAQQRLNLKRAYETLWFSGTQKAEALEQLRQTMGDDPNVMELVTFVENSKRGIHRPKRTRPESEALIEESPAEGLPELV